MNSPQPPIVKIKPTDKPCQRQLRLDAAGKPHVCGRSGYVELESVPLCQEHFKWQRLAEEAKELSPVSLPE